MLAIDVRNIVKKFGDFTAVKGLSFNVEDGEIFGLLGPNGAGKSTLIRMLTTLLPPTSGTAVISGFDVTLEADSVRRSIGVIPQALTSDLELSVEENLLIFAKLYGVPREKRDRLIPELLEAVELTQWRKAPVKNLSGGMRRRVEIARGLVHEPRIFFLDEPTTGLDPVSRVAVWEMLRKIKAERDLTVLLTTHYMDEADKLCDRIAIVDHGELKALDSPMRLKASIPGHNALEVSFSGVPTGEKGLHAYFVHSYHLKPAEPRNVLATTDYGSPLTASVARDNLIGVQFHPEKSQRLGLALIANFLRWRP